jgi:hypothetical protein
MDLGVVGLLAGLLLAGCARPRWWLSLPPVAITVGLVAYRLSLPRSTGEDAVAFLGIVLLTVAMEGALVAGALGRAGFERSKSRPGRASEALGAARTIALVGLALVAAAVVVSRAATGLAILLSVAAVTAVLVRAWRARMRRGPRRPRSRRVVATRVHATAARRPQRRVVTPREVARAQRRRVRS